MINEIKRRRTLAIISHPDAGKTTLTEKLLLYSGAIEIAGSVVAKKHQRDTSSDWMELEKKRGISVSSTVLQFDYNEFKFNLLDTPGHRDFSEDTYRVLTAVDGVIMVIDAAKGIESQTIKLFNICKNRKIPILTFINKLDRPAKPPIELIDQLEEILGLTAFPINWPIESGESFKGLFDRLNKEVHLFQRSPGGVFKAPFTVHSITDKSFRELMSDDVYNNLTEEIQLLDHIGVDLDYNKISNGEISPVYFGSAVTNFGVELLLKGFLDYSNPPIPRKTAQGEIVPLDNPEFSAFVFKIQTNMNPMHRDRMVFARVCAGKFRRNAKVFNTRLKKEVRLAFTHSVFGNERETINEAYPGDIIGFVTNTEFKIGDTISTNEGLAFERIPRFAPEIFAYIKNRDTSKHKSFRKGLDHLIAEDIVQTFQVDAQFMNVPLLGALGSLQFEVLQYRLSDEYGVETELEVMPWSLLRWVESPVDDEFLRSKISYHGVTGTDAFKKQVLFFKSNWGFKSFKEANPEISLVDTID
ncbi:MAG: peptide chain release factor 3 [Spirochaetales bacterium]|nr:peptide chain release factor 3 [Spirochaetales bacterium]